MDELFLLDRLGIPKAVQEFFRYSFETDASGNLVFDYGEGKKEHFGLDFHLVPSVTGFWTAGCLEYQQVKEVFVCCSAMEAIAFLRFTLHRYPSLDNLLFLSLGSCLLLEHYVCIQETFSNTKFNLIYPDEIIGRLTCLKLALAISRQPVRISLIDENVIIGFRYQEYLFTQDSFSLSAFYKEAGFWPANIKVFKPKKHLSWLAKLMENTQNFK